MGKNLKKNEYNHIYMNRFAVRLKLAQQCTSTALQ